MRDWNVGQTVSKSGRDGFRFQFHDECLAFDLENKNALLVHDGETKAYVTLNLIYC